MGPDMTTEYDESTFYPEGFPRHEAFFIRDIQRKDWWPYRPIDGQVDALWLLGDDSLPDGLLQGPLFRPRSGWWLAASADVDAGPRFVKATASLGGIREGQGEEVVKLWHRAGWLATL